jgi:hypothetical protein
LGWYVRCDHHVLLTPGMHRWLGSNLVLLGVNGSPNKSIALG